MSLDRFLVGHSNGPGIAATVVLELLLAELVNKNVLTVQEVAAILSVADSTLERMGEQNAVPSSAASSAQSQAQR